MLSYPFGQLTAFCDSHPIGSKLLFVPAAQAGYNLTTALALTGYSWVNLRTLTPVQHAEEIAGPALRCAGWRPLAADEDLFLLERIVEESLRESDGYFSEQQLARGGLARSFQRALHGLRLAGLRPESLRQGAVPMPKAGPVARVYERYLAHLEEEKLYDQARLFSAAIGLAGSADLTESFAGGEQTAYAIMDETPLPELAHRYVVAVAGAGLCRLGRRDYGLPPPALCAASRFADLPFPAAPSPAESSDAEVKASPPTAPIKAGRRRRKRRPPPPGALVQGDLFQQLEFTPSAVGSTASAETLSTANAVGSTASGETLSTANAVGSKAGGETLSTPNADGAPASGGIPKAERPPGGEGQTAGEGDAGVAAGGRLLTTGLSPADTADLDLCLAVGAENEVRGVLRQLLVEETRLDAVEIAYTSETPYLSLLLDAAERFDLPATFAAGIPAVLTRPGRALAGFCRWILSDFGTRELVHLCRTGTVRLDAALDGGRLSAPRFASLLEAARLVRGREAYAAALQRLAVQMAQRESDSNRPSRDGGEESRLRLAQRAAAALLDLVPEGPHATLRQVAEACARFLTTFAEARGERERRCLTSLVDRLGELGDAAQVQGSVSVLVRRILELAESHSADASVARPGKLYLTPLERAGYSGRSHLFVLGMDESRFPGGGAEDPILLDDERAAVSGALTLMRHRPGERVWHLVRVLGMWPGKVTLVAQQLSLSDGRQPHPSPQFQQAAEEMAVVPTVLRPVPATRQEALDESEALLTIYRAPGYRQRVLERYPGLVRGDRACRARGHGALTRYDGWIGARPELAITPRPGQVMSAIRLETLARCPFRYFLRYALGLKPPETAEAEPTRWLQPQEAGTLLHDLYRDFMLRLRDRGERPDAERHQKLVLEMLAEKVAEWEERTPVVYPAAHAADRARLERAARVFLNAEAARLDQMPWVEPAAFELAFGAPGESVGEAVTGAADDRPELKARPSPVLIRLSERVQFMLQGRVDRIDRVRGPGGGGDEVGGTGHEIWDYKTGSTFGYEDGDLLGGGAHLQWALYAYAVEQIWPGSPVRSSGYFFAGDRGFGRRFESVPPAPAEMGMLLEPLFEMVSQGAFFHVQKGEECTFCDYRKICADERKSRRDLEAMCDATSHLRTFGHELAKLVESGTQEGSRESIRAFLGETGIEPLDLVPEEVEVSASRWMAGLQQELRYGSRAPGAATPANGAGGVAK